MMSALLKAYAYMAEMEIKKRGVSRIYEPVSEEPRFSLFEIKKSDFNYV